MTLWPFQRRTTKAMTRTEAAFMYGGVQRRVVTLSCGVPYRPLVMVLHSAYTTIERMSALIAAEEMCVRDKVNVVMPEGLPGTAPRWDHNPNLGYSRGIPDVAFLHYVLDHVTLPYAGIYMMGFSEGAMMINRFLLDGDGASRINAAGCVSGALLTAYTKDPVRWKASHPVPMMMINGTSDTTVDYKGSIGVHSAPQSIAYWANLGGPTNTSDWDIDDTVADGTVTTVRSFKGANRFACELWTVAGGGHAWPGSTKNLPTAGNVSMDFDATRVAAAFFRDS